MFQKKRCVATKRVWFPYDGFIEPGTLVDIRWGIRWAHIYMNGGEKLGKILQSAAKQKFVELK